ncbi:MAG: MFS transporter [Alphaproteobacteria bacterium]|nr:MFS transporter [Alphaproteobacteria bacterium]
MTITPDRRNTLLLAVCQALYLTSASLLSVTAPLVGLDLALDKSLATLPIAAQHAGIMVVTMPASQFMRRFGRRAGFQIGALFGCLGAAILAFAVVERDFTLFNLGAFVIGWFNGFAVFYRFAAADTALPEDRARAISWVLAGGIAAAFAGPELAKYSKDLLLPTLFAGCYVAQMGVLLMSAAVVSFVDIPRLSAAERKHSGRPLMVILRQPDCLVAVTMAVVSYAIMALLMAATPIAMAADQFVFADAATVIQWHLIGMYAPAFVTGHLIRRFGAASVMIAGILLNMACAGLGVSGHGFVNYWGALLLVGVGWNFMFVAATAILTGTHTAAERAKVQGFNDFLIFATVAAAALASGGLLHWVGWQAVNLGMVPPLVLALLAALWLRRQRSAAVSL